MEILKAFRVRQSHIERLLVISMLTLKSDVPDVRCVAFTATQQDIIVFKYGDECFCVTLQRCQYLTGLIPQMLLLIRSQR
jgi:hypothetical protein